MDRERKAFPTGGGDWPELRVRMREMACGDADWQKGRVPLFVFRNDEDSYTVGREAYFDFFTENALGRNRAFHSIAAMEADVLDYGLDLFTAPEEAGGAFTSGGSESIFMAIKAARDRFRARCSDLAAAPLNIVMPITGHPAFDKAAQTMDLEIRRAPLVCDMRVDVAAAGRLIDERTIALVGSAPCFPHGVIDPIGELSDLAGEHDVWLHVDACVGGWLAPFFKRIGRATPDFDFRFANVCSISADLHKFGFCPKPASTVFYRDRADLERATFRADAWPNGIFATPTLLGTRPGGAVAGAWAVLNHLGVSGYEAAARRMAAMTDAYLRDLAAIPEIELWVEPDLTLINFGSHAVDIYAVARTLEERGWVTGLTRAPKGLHLMLSALHEPAREAYVADLKAGIVAVREHKTEETEMVARY